MAYFVGQAARALYTQFEPYFIIVVLQNIKVFCTSHVDIYLTMLQ